MYLFSWCPGEVKIMKHPSYGMMSISRYYGGDGNFFGNDLPMVGSGGIEIVLKEATLERNANGLHCDSFNPGKLKFRVKMSHLQFAELITNMNTTGVPVTITNIGTERLDDPPILNKREVFDEEAEEVVSKTKQRANDIIAKVQNLFESKKSLTKKDKEEILSELNQLRMATFDHLPFMQKMFNEQMNKSVVSAKANIAAFIEQKRLALKALKEENKECM